MPTAGEARLQSSKKTSKDAVSYQGKARTAVKPRPIKSGEGKRRTVSQTTSGKSSIPVPLKKGVKGKENADPYDFIPKSHVTISQKLMNVDTVVTINKKSTKVKQAPDFRKLHQKWENRLCKGKAVSKKKNTTFEPFNLAAENSQQTFKFKKPYAYSSEDEQDLPDDDVDDFEIDSTALKEILSNTGIKDEDLRLTGRATIAAIPSSKSGLTTQSAAGFMKRTSIYYTGPPTQHALRASSSVSRTPRPALANVSSLKPRQVDNAPAMSQASSCVKKQVAWADEVSENDVFEFQPDSQALQSILSNAGITFNQVSAQHTSRVTLAGGRLTPYRRTRQSFREEPTKRTSIYYTGPRRTRLSPRACGMGRTSVLGTRQMTAGPAVSLQKTTAYDPLATMVGRQGNQELENEPIVSSGSMQFSTVNTEPNFQTANNNLLSTPARELVSSTQLSSARNQPSWAEIFTPQRGAITQDSSAQATCSQPSFEPLRTPVKQPALQEDICTPQRVTSIQNAAVTPTPGRSTFAISSSHPLGELNQQHKTLLTPARQVPIHCQPFSSDRPPIWSEIFTPQRGTRQFPATKDMVTHFINNPLATPVGQTLSVTRGSNSTQDLGPRLQCSTVQITSFQPTVEPSSCSVEEFKTPKQIPGVRNDQFKLTTVEEEDDIIRLQRQALEDLGLLTITEESLTDTPGPRANIQGNNNFIRSPTFTIGMNQSNTDNPTTATAQETSLRSVSTYQSADVAGDAHVSSCKPMSAGGFQTSRVAQLSSFSPVVRLATPTPVRESNTNIHTTRTRGASSIPFNSTPLFCHQDLAENNAPRVDEIYTCNGPRQSSSFLTYSKVNHTQCVVPTPVKASNRSALETTFGEPCVTSVSRTGPIQTTSRRPCVTAVSRTSPVQTRALTSEENLPKEPYNRPVQVVSPTPKTEKYKHAPSDNRSLSLRSALSSNSGNHMRQTITEDSTAFGPDVNTRFRWEPNVREVTPSAFRSTATGSRRIPKTLAQEALLDMEVSVYMTSDRGRLATSSWSERPMNPLAKVFTEGDSRHFLPINIYQTP